MISAINDISRANVHQSVRHIYMQTRTGTGVRSSYLTFYDKRLCNYVSQPEGLDDLTDPNSP